MGVVGTSAVLARPVSAKAFVERGKRVTNARRAFGGGDGGAKAEAARKEALASARESSSAAARARRLLDYSPGSSTPDGTGRAVGSDATTPLTSPKKQGTKVDAKDATASGGKDTASTEPATKPARRRSTTSTGVFSPPRSPKSPLMSPGMKSPTKSDDAPEKSPGSVSPAAALAATAAAARVPRRGRGRKRRSFPAPRRAGGRGGAGGARERGGCGCGGARAQVEGSAVRREFAGGCAFAGRCGGSDSGGDAPSPRCRGERGGAARAEGAGAGGGERARRRARRRRRSRTGAARLARRLRTPRSADDGKSTRSTRCWRLPSAAPRARPRRLEDRTPYPTT